MYLPFRSRDFRLPRNCVLAGLTLLVPEAWAAAATPDENPYLEDLPTVLTVSRLPQPQNEAPGSVTVIDGELIRATGYRDLARVFRLVPGMQVGQERGNSQWVTYHGLSSTFPSEMQVLIDGRSVYSPASFGGVDWSTLPLTLDEIERIEVVRGTNPVTYGANAFLGVINIITRHSADAEGAHLALGGGNARSRDFSASTATRSEGLSLRVNAQRQADDGFRDLYDGRQVTVMSARADYQVSASDELSFRVAGSQADKDAGYPESRYRNNPPRTQQSENYSAHGSWTHNAGEGREWLVHYYHNQERVADRWISVGPAFAGYPDGVLVPLDMQRRAVRDHLEAQQRSPLGATVQSVWGAEARRDEVHAPLLFAGRDTVTSSMYRLFGNLEWKFAPCWQATGGAAVEQSEHVPLRLAPRAFVNWQASPGTSWRAGYARAWQQYPLFETQGDVRGYAAGSGVLVANPYVPNPTLSQPRVDSFELGYLGRFQPLTSSLDVRLFRERIVDYIYRRATTSPENPLLNEVADSAQYVNSGSALTLTGVETQFKAHPWYEAEWLLSHTLIRNRSADANTAHRVAPYAASLSWRQGWGGGWSSMLTGLRMGPLAGGDGYVPIYSYQSRAYTTFDARLALTRRVAGHKVEYSLNAINLGEPHQEIADRSQQSLRSAGAANLVSPLVYVGVALEL